MNTKIKGTLKDILIVCLGVLVFGGIAIGAEFMTDRVQNQNIENYYEAETQITIASNDDDDDGLIVSGGGPSLRVPWDFKEGIKVDGDFIVDGDKLNYYNISVECSTDNRGTTTPDGTDGSGLSTITTCYWQNPDTDDDLVIEDLRMDIIETFSLAGSFQCGTTTSLTTQTAYPYHIWTAPDGTATLATSTPSVIASTTVSTTFDSKINGMIGVDTEPGGAIIADADEFVLEGNAFIVCGWTPHDATSTDSFSTKGGFTGNLVLKGKAYLRGE